MFRFNFFKRSKYKNKYFILTDERSGGTVFTNLFEQCGLRIIHDPQTDTNKRLPHFKGDQFSSEILEFSFKKFDVVKCCLISFSKEQYRGLVSYCNKKGVTIIILQRNNFYRSLSKCISLKLNHYNKWKNMSDEKKSMKYILDKNDLINQYENHNDRYNAIIEFMNQKNIEAYFVGFEDFYDNNLGEIFFDELSLDIQNYELFCRLMNLDYGTDKKYANIENFDEIVELKAHLQKKTYIMKYNHNIEWKKNSNYKY